MLVSVALWFVHVTQYLPHTLRISAPAMHIFHTPTQNFVCTHSNISMCYGEGRRYVLVQGMLYLGSP